MAAEAVGADSAALLFVYGSLMRGQPAHTRMIGCPWQGPATLQGLALHDLGPFPMAVASDDPALRLHGELYAVDAAQLAALDRYEGAPRLYGRQLRSLADGRTVWVYVGRPHQVRHAPLIASGRWSGRRAAASRAGVQAAATSQRPAAASASARVEAASQAMRLFASNLRRTTTAATQPSSTTPL